MLHVVNWLRRGGVETQLLRILRDYDRDRFHLDVCCVGAAEGELAGEARRLDAEVLRCPKSIDLLGFSRRFERLLRARPYDVVHSHFDLWSGPLLRGAARAGVPVRLAHMRGIARGRSRTRGRLKSAAHAVLLRAGRRWVRRDATKILGVSAAVLDDCWPGWRSAPGRFEVLTGGVDTTRFAPPEQPPPEGRFEVLTVGSLLALKRHDVAVAALAHLRRTCPTARLTLIGRGPTEARVRARARALGVSPQVELAGQLDRDLVVARLQGASVALSCSEVEGLPNALLEALAVGLPVVASDIPPHRELLGPVAPDLLFPPGDAQAAARRLERLATDPGLSRDVGQRGRAHALEHYDSARCLGRLQALYEELLNPS